MRSLPRSACFSAFARLPPSVRSGKPPGAAPVHQWGFTNVSLHTAVDCGLQRCRNDQFEQKDTNFQCHTSLTGYTAADRGCPLPPAKKLMSI
jgi:hypothetical protein